MNYIACVGLSVLLTLLSSIHSACAMLSSAACLALLNFHKLTKKTARISEKKNIEPKLGVLIFCTAFVGLIAVDRKEPKRHFHIYIYIGLHEK